MRLTLISFALLVLCEQIVANVLPDDLRRQAEIDVVTLYHNKEAQQAAIAKANTPKLHPHTNNYYGFRALYNDMAATLQSKEGAIVTNKERFRSCVAIFITAHKAAENGKEQKAEETTQDDAENERRAFRSLLQMLILYGKPMLIEEEKANLNVLIEEYEPVFHRQRYEDYILPYEWHVLVAQHIGAYLVQFHKPINSPFPFDFMFFAPLKIKHTNYADFFKHCNLRSSSAFFKLHDLEFSVLSA